MTDFDFQYLLKVALSFAFVLILIAGTLGGLKKFKQNSSFKGLLKRGTRETPLEIVQMKNIDLSSKLVVVQYRGKQYLLSVCTHGTTVIANDPLDISKTLNQKNG
ncbi:MAG: flagellar biosynthetic protein FliO [Candidatus Nucleicultricaceae bacterium]